MALSHLILAVISSKTAALEDRRISADDLKLAVKLAIAPRGIFMQSPPEDEEMMVRYTNMML